MPNLNLNYKTVYGLTWPVDVQQPLIDLLCAKKWMLSPYRKGVLLEPGEHLLRAIRALFSPTDWRIDPWTELRAHCWAKEDFMIWLGAASTGKSFSAGGFAVLDWICDPTQTYIALGSTSVPMLKLRSFAAVTEIFRLLKRNSKFSVPGKEHSSTTAIINEGDAEDTDSSATLKASIRGVALDDGSEAKAVAKLAGVHLPFVTLILDELSALPEAAANARFNARAGTQRFRFVGLANPVDQFDLSARLAEPVGGWGSVSPDTESWDSKFGKVLHFNGFKSPAIVLPEGDTQFPYLINRKQIDDMLKDAGGNEDDPLIWRMVLGFPAGVGMDSTVLSTTDITAFRMAEAAVWDTRDREERVLVAGLDPAFTSGGDGCMFRAARVGYFREGVYGIEFLPVVRIPISVSSLRPAAYQVVDGAREQLAKHGVRVENLCIDDSGTQSVADIVQVETGTAPIRCVFNGKPLEEPPVGEQPRYKDQVTEMWASVAALGRNGQVRAFDPVVASQFCRRRFKRGERPLCLESKKEYKKRTKLSSPDEGDATALCVRAALLRCGLSPGKGRLPTPGFAYGPRVILPGQGVVAAGYTTTLDMRSLLRYARSRQ